MKKISILLIIAGSLIFLNAPAQDYYQGSVKVVLTTTGPQAVFLMKLTASSGSKANGFSGIEFFLTYSSAYTLTFGTPVNNTTNFPTLAMVYGGQNTWGNPSGRKTEWWYFTGVPTTTQTYTAGTEYEVFRVPISSSSLDFGDLNLEYDGSGFITYLVFTDQFGTGWTTADQGINAPLFYGPGSYTGSNGTGVQGGGSCMYTITNKPLVPMVLWEAAAWSGGTGPGNSPGSSDGTKKCYVRDLNGPVTSSNALVSNLIIQTGGSLQMQPNGALTASGPTTITDAGSFKVNADASGIGSFIDNGTINYGASGSASAQTYLANSAAVGSYFIHQIGPTVNDPAFQASNGYPGVYLSSFDLVTLGTYAYFYNETANNWTNVYNPTTLVPAAKGLILSTTDNTNHTLTMTGKLLTGNVVTSFSLGHSGNNIDLISNPYPSSIDFDLFYGTNSGTIGTTYYIWDPTIGNYKSYTTPSGGTLTDMIKPGQGFFVTTTAAGPVSFINGHRTHSSGALVKDMTPNLLTIEASGNTYKDYTNMLFKDGATFSYDELYDANKWASMFEDATELSSLSADQNELCFNSMPLLGHEMVSVPMNFKCGADGNYTLTASNMESFESGTEIWLEDLQIGGEWYSLNNNPVYEFTAAPGDPKARFIVHFFGPTGIDDPIAAKNAIQIYGYQQNAYIVNHGTETVKEYRIYDMMGRELLGGTLVDKDVNVVPVNNVSAYYIVKVFTKEGGVYTGKVFITK